jgi:hypothetical protein
VGRADEMSTPKPAPEARCEVTELLVGQCGCRLHAGASGTRARGLTMEPYARRNGDSPIYGPPVVARYGGRCPECQERYEPGHTIRPQRFRTVDVGTGQWAHAECAEEQS